MRATGNTHAAIVGRTHVPLPRPRPLRDGRRRDVVRSPIKPPEGGWAGPEPLRQKPRKEPKPRQARAQEHTAITTRRQQLAALAGDGWSAQRIAKHLGVSHQTVRRDAKAAGVTLRDARGSDAEGARRWDVDRAVELARQGHTLAEIVAEVGGRYETVRRGLKRRGVPPRTEAPGRLPDHERARIIAMHRAGTSKKQIAADTGWSYSLVKYVTKEAR